jgi:hypothetical protein
LGWLWLDCTGIIIFFEVETEIKICFSVSAYSSGKILWRIEKATLA